MLKKLVSPVLFLEISRQIRYYIWYCVTEF